MNYKWPLVPLGEVLTERREIPDANDLISGRIRIVAKIGFNDGQIQLRADGETKTGMILIQPGDLVVSGINAVKGAIAIYNNENTENVAATIHYGAYIPDSRRVTAEYLWWLLRSNTFKELLSEHLPGGIKTELKAKRLLRIPVPLAPLLEQRRLVERIDALAAKIAEAKELRKKADEERTALEASFTNALFSSEVAKGWPVHKLGELAHIQSGVTLGRTISGPTLRSPYLRVANVQDGHLNLSVIKEVEIRPEEFEKWKLIPGDLLLTEGGDWDKLGRGTVWQGEIPDCIHQNHIFRVRVAPTVLDSFFLSIFIASPYGKGYFQEASKQTTNLASINQRQLKAFQVFVPPIEDQKRTVSRVYELRDKLQLIKKNQDSIQVELQALLPAILDRAFRGELA